MPTKPSASAAARTAARLLPSGRVLLLGWAVAAAIAGAYTVARQTSIFAVHQIEVRGAPAAVAAQVERVAAGVRGSSLVSLDGSSLLARVDAIPTVSGARYDRAFPHTLRLVVQPERPVAVLRVGPESWLVSASGRVAAHLRRRAHAELPRIWVPASTGVALGETLDERSGGAAARALAPLARTSFPGRITSVTLAGGELTFMLAGGLELRLGRPADLRLKMAVARRILRVLPHSPGYLDVSVPERPVSASNSQVSG